MFLISVSLINLILLAWLITRSYRQESDAHIKYRRLRMVY